MKKIALLISFTIILVFTLFWYYRSGTPIEILETKTQEEISNNILLYPESGDVSFKTTPDGIFQKATTSPTIIPNQTIVHTDNGKASVLLPDNSFISLDSDTEITVNYSKEKISIYQSFGATYHRVEKLITGSSYQVQTQGTLAAVRGTKFAVAYDLKKKVTKVSVTENKVQVSTLPSTLILGTTTKPVEETVLIEEGKTAQVDTLTKVEGVREYKLHVVETKNDIEMRALIEKHKDRDIEIDSLKKEIFNNKKEESFDVKSEDYKIKEEKFRKEIKRVIFKDDEDEYFKKEEETIYKKEVIKSSTTKDTVIKKTPITPPEDITPIAQPSVKKLGEEEFFTSFEALFIKYFYVGVGEEACTLKVTPEERVRVVTSFAVASGYPFTRTSLLSFAQEINKYCSTNDKILEVRLQNRFDDEYPF